MSCECFKQVGHFNVETVGNDSLLEPASCGHWRNCSFSNMILIHVDWVTSDSQEGTNI